MEKEKEKWEREGGRRVEGWEREKHSLKNLERSLKNSAHVHFGQLNI